MEGKSTTSLPTGFRFHPTDEELVLYYLRRKVCRRPLRLDIIPEIDIYKYEPWDLPGQSRLKSRDLEWYFFSVMDKNYGNGSRRNRATDKGFWKPIGKDQAIHKGSRTVGMKKSLMYYSGRAPHGKRTDWLMHEYRLMDDELKKTGVVQDAFLLCRISQKSGPGPKNEEQYGDDDGVVFDPGEMAEASYEADDLEQILMELEQSTSKCLDSGLDSDSKAKGLAWDGEKDFDLRCSDIKEKVQVLNRKKDIVSLILSYPPMDSVNKERHKGWIQDVLDVNHMVTEKEAPFKTKEINVSVLSSRITRLLDHSLADLEAYVPLEIIDKMCILEVETVVGAAGCDIMPMQENLVNLAANFAIRQILQDIENPKVLRIGISGRDGIRVTVMLNNLTKIKELFCAVVQVDVSLHSTSRSIEENIAAQLGLSQWTGPELDEMLKDKNFLIILENIHEGIELYKMGSNWWNLNKIQKIVFVTRFLDVHQRMAVDLEIRMEDHLLSWELFCLNVGNVVHSSGIQRLAIHVVKRCRGHLLAIVLMARCLKEINEVHIWEYASQALALQPASQMKDEVLFHALAFICGRLGPAKAYLKYFADMDCWRGLEQVKLIDRWFTGGLIRRVNEGEQIVRNLVDAFLLESSLCGDSVFVRMRGEIHELLLDLLGLETESLFLWLGGKQLTEAPKDEAWEKANEMHLMNNKLSELPVSPNCPQLRVLFLQTNHHLRVIPSLFFEYMPLLQILDLSYTRIKSLPLSVFKLVKLKIFLLRGCKLLMGLPHEVGELSNLEVLDLEETQIVSLPENVGRLTNLKSLKMSFYSSSNHGRRNNQSNAMIPRNVISKLFQLEELSIHVNPDDEQWNVTVKDIVKEICSCRWLETLKLYLPEVSLLNDFTGTINLSSMNFRFIVGSHRKRFVSRLPHEIAVKCEQRQRCLKYVNGECVPLEVKEVLQYATSLLLDRHLTLTKLSEFGIGNIKKLEFCLLGECSKMETIVDGSEIYKQGDEDLDVPEEIILGSLQYLRLHHMKNLVSIWKGPIWMGCLSSLRSLELHACPQLTTIFTLDLLEKLSTLEELVAEQCPEINSIVTIPPVEELLSSRRLSSRPYLPNLKKLSLHYMPKLISISSGVPIAPELEWISVYHCPSNETLYDTELSSDELKVIVGQVDWWRALKLETSPFGYFHLHKLDKLDKLDSIFVPIKQGADLMTQLAEIDKQFLAPKEDIKPSQPSASAGSGQELIGSLSASEIELSEDYTCVISHGPNPKTTHLYGDCILECHTNDLADLNKNEEQKKGSPLVLDFLEIPTPYPTSDFLRICYSCKKELEEGKDIYMYRGEKAFCSSNCRSQEILIEEQMEKMTDDFCEKSPCSHEELFETSMLACRSLHKESGVESGIRRRQQGRRP